MADNSKSKVDKDFSMADPSDQTETGQTTLLADSLKTENDKGDFSIDPVNSQTEYDGSSMSFDDFINDVIADLRVRLENDFENTKKSFANQNMADHVFTVNNSGGNREELSQSDETGGDMDLKAEEVIDVKEEAGTLKTEELLKELSDFAEELDLKMLFCDGKEDEDNVEEKTAVEIPADSMPVEEDQAEIDHPEDALLLEEVTAEVFSDEKNSLPDASLPDDSFKADRKEEKTATDSLKELTEEFSGIEPAKTGQEKPEFVKNDISHTGLSDEVNENDPLLKEINALYVRAVFVKHSIEDLEEKARSLDHVVSEKEAVIAHFDGMITERQNLLASMETILDNHQKKVIEKENTLNELEKMIMERRDKIDELDNVIMKRKADFKSKAENQMKDVEKSMNSYMEQMRNSFSSFMQGVLSDITNQDENPGDGEE